MHSNFTHRTAQKLALLACCALFFSKISVAQSILEPPVSLGGGGANSVEIYDFDGDGDNDVVRFGTDGQVRWHENVGGKLGHDLPTNPVILASNGYARDFDKDGDRDLIVSDAGDIFWFENLDGKSSFGSKNFVAAGGDFFVEDFDGDGDFDVLRQQKVAGTFIWNKNDGVFSPFPAEVVSIESQPNLSSERTFAQKNWEQVSFIDNPVTGLPDVVGFSYYIDNGRGLYVLRMVNNGNGKFSPVVRVVYHYHNDFYGGSIKFNKPIDLNADGYKEIPSIRNRVSLNGYSAIMGVIDLSLQEIDEVYVDGISYPNSLPPFDDFITIDLNGDNKMEMIANRGKWLTYFPVYLSKVGKKDNVFKDAGYAFQSPLAKGDINKDGKEEFLCNVNGNISIFGSFLQNVYEFTAKGSVFLDKNENGQKDSGEPNLSNRMVQLSPTLYTSIAQDSSGYNISAYAWSGTTVVCNAYPNWDFTTPASVQFFFTKDTIVNFDFGLKPKTKVIAANIDLTSANPRCNQQVPFWLTVENAGTEPFDGLLALDYPNSLATFVKATPPPDSVFGKTYFWKISGQVPTHLQKIEVINKIAGASNVGKFIVLKPILQVFDPTTGGVLTSASTIYEHEIRCGFDPNDKLLAPDQAGDDNFIHKNSELNYTIRFQNTGNDTAFAVKIVDKLDENLDWSSLRVIGSSHEPFFLNLDSRGELTAEFPNIQLPDSTTNFVASNGFIKFSIRPENWATAGTKINNEAKIFFDSNPPVSTNSVESTVSHDLFNIKIEQPCTSQPQGSASVSPNFIENGGLQFDWGFSNEPQVIFPTAGQYPLSIRQNGVLLLDTILSIENLPTNGYSSFSPATPGLADGWVKVNANGGGGIFTYLWDTPNADTTPKVVGLAAGTYHCTVTSQFGCSQVFTVVLESKISDADEPSALPLLEVSPNPNAGSFQLKISNLPAADFTVEISNSLGILEKTFQPQDFQKSANFLEINGLEAGLHFVSLKIGSRQVVKKVVVLR